MWYKVVKQNRTPQSKFFSVVSARAIKPTIDHQILIYKTNKVGAH